MGAGTRQLGIAAAAAGQWGRSPRFHARGPAADRVDVTVSPGAAFERIEPDTASWAAYFSNHIHRYMFAAEKLKEVGARHVLDAACGVGYGACYLADAAAVTSWARTGMRARCRSPQTASRIELLRGSRTTATRWRRASRLAHSTRW
jgi:hypothetical protein